MYKNANQNIDAKVEDAKVEDTKIEDAKVEDAKAQEERTDTEIENKNNKILSDAKVDVGIKPDVNDNMTKVLLCSCNFQFSLNCCNKA